MAGDDAVDDFRVRIEAAVIKRLHREGQRPRAAIRPDAAGAWDRRRQRRDAGVADVLQARYLAATARLPAGSSTILLTAVLVHTVDVRFFCSASFALFVSLTFTSLVRSRDKHDGHPSQQRNVHHP